MSREQFVDQMALEVQQLRENAEEAVAAQGFRYDLNQIKNLGERMNADAGQYDLPLVAVCGGALKSFAENISKSTPIGHEIIDTYLAVARAILVHDVADKTLQASDELLEALGRLTHSILTGPGDVERVPA